MKYVMRKILEKISQKRVLKRYLPEKFGSLPIFVSPDSRLSFWKQDLDESDERLFAVAEEFVKQGYTVWDIGANVGLFTFAAAFLASPSGYILSVEADNWLSDLLRKTSSLASDTRAKVDVLNTAVDNRMQISRFNIAQRGRASNFLEGFGSTQAGGIRETHLMVTVTLDWLLNHFPQPNLIKIDVEGAEGHVLEGGERILSEVKPIILCEISSHSASTIASLLHSHNYIIFDMEAEKQKRQPIITCAPNIIAIPQKDS
jgi:FkbM family methyltransferase